MGLEPTLCFQVLLLKNLISALVHIYHTLKLPPNRESPKHFPSLCSPSLPPETQFAWRQRSQDDVAA